KNRRPFDRSHGSLKESKELQHSPEFLDTDFQVLNDGPQCLAFEFSLVHRDNHARLVSLTHINCVAASLPTPIARPHEPIPSLWPLAIEPCFFPQRLKRIPQTT